MSTSTSYSDQSAVIWVIRLLLVYSIAYLSTKRAQLRGSVIAIAIALSYISPIALSWLATVSKNVPEPYLDEIFHIPQAQVYCQGKYLEWDDKITTPPGLYILTLLYNRLLGLSCSVLSLRAFNADIVAWISVVALVCKAHLTQRHTQTETGRRISPPDIATGISIASFPVIFFFSGLYYTDPASTLVVLLAYANHLSRVGAEQPSLLNDIYSLILGITTLCFRQTNIFWVVVYMGGLETIHVIKTLNPKPIKTPKFPTVAEQVKFYAWRYSLGDIHDPPVSPAQPIDIVLCVLSIAIAALWNLPKVLVRFVWPHGIVLAMFIGFVAWNGGVVLGDKSNHVATLHFAQMLYIWPLFAFFSAPLFIPKIFNLASSALRTVKPQGTRETNRSDTFTGVDICLVLFHRASIALVFCGAVAIALLIVRFNTIIHPFTLADNRHYMFYVFRYSILRAWWVRYALAPIYILCAWMCWSALQGAGGASATQGGRWIQSPFTTISQIALSATSKEGSIQTQGAAAGLKSPPTSTVLMLLLATTFSLVTAPLVEPRYFILPWVFWRLLVPSPSSSESTKATTPKAKNTAASSKSRQSDSSQNQTPSGVIGNLALVFEIVWFMVINFATMYIFIARPFYWWAPDGSLLDEGRAQRFMW